MVTCRISPRLTMKGTVTEGVFSSRSGDRARAGSEAIVRATASMARSQVPPVGIRRRNGGYIPAQFPGGTERYAALDAGDRLAERSRSLSRMIWIVSMGVDRYPQELE